MADGEEWSTDANQAIDISLVTACSTGLNAIDTFHPKFTYSIFGDAEQIFGYKGLKIQLRYHASDMRPCLTVSHDKKFPAVDEETEPVDVKATLRDFLPEVAYQRLSEYQSAIHKVRDDWKPPGELVTSFESKGAQYEVWKGSLATPAVKQIVRRIQIFVPFFIEGGTLLDLDQPDVNRWTIFFLYERRPKPAKDGEFTYVFAGYSTVYRFFFMQVPTPPDSPNGQKSAPKDELELDGKFDLSQLPCRTRISQFIIIPPFQRKGLGDKLYSTLYQQYLNHTQTLEITVEDPNEAFDDLRDIADLQFLRGQSDFLELQINTDIRLAKDGNVPSNIVEKSSAESIRKKYKIAPRQFARVLEMHLMSILPDSVRPGFELEKDSGGNPNERYERRLWRLLVKQRVYRQNKDLLGQLDLDQRVTKLDETVNSVEFDYARILNMVNARGSQGVASSTQGKRKLEDGQTSASKKARIEEA